MQSMRKALAILPKVDSNYVQGRANILCQILSRLAAADDVDEAGKT